MKLTALAIALLTVDALAVKAQTPAGCQGDPPRSLPGLWTYYWYSAQMANRQKALCFTQNGKRVYFPATTINSHQQPAPDARLVAQLRPLPLPDDLYYWYSAGQAANQQWPFDSRDPTCVWIDGTLKRYTEATLYDHPDGKAKDYRFLGKGNRYTEVYGAACVSEAKKK
jgi:hypothetical protein